MSLFESPSIIRGSVAFRNRDLVVEPRVKRCYFASVLAVMLKRDITENPLTGLVDKILELADIIYKQFHQPEYHSEHLLKDVNIMNRFFDFRDQASDLVPIDECFASVVKHCLKRFFKSNSGGVAHFTNVCYGFWYCQNRESYYYLDPYPCDINGRKTTQSDGAGCLMVFSKLGDMVSRWCCNKASGTTGFFIHRLHVESVNMSPIMGPFREDPMWSYLDYHWSYKHYSDR